MKKFIDKMMYSKITTFIFVGLTLLLMLIGIYLMLHVDALHHEIKQDIYLYFPGFFMTYLTLIFIISMHYYFIIQELDYKPIFNQSKWTYRTSFLISIVLLIIPIMTTLFKSKELLHIDAYMVEPSIYLLESMPYIYYNVVLIIFNIIGIMFYEYIQSPKRIY